MIFFRNFDFVGILNINKKFINNLTAINFIYLNLFDPIGFYVILLNFEMQKNNIIKPYENVFDY